jgi:DNA-binding transcriptional ArsR family regulator
MPLTSASADLGPSAAQVAQLVSRGMRPAQIAAELGLSKSTVSFHLKRLGVDLGRGYIGRRVICEILGRSGVRASELCDLKIGQVRIHDPHGARFRIPDSKTETGVREVQMSPDLVEAVVEHLDRLRQIGGSMEPETYLVPNLHGGRLNRQRVGQVVGEAAKLASSRLTAKGLPPLPNTTPHSLRRTYISIALLANNFDVKWVMGQVGHADSRMTLDVYAQLEQRVDRSHGHSFDRFIRRAKEQLSGLSIGPAEAQNPGSRGLFVGDSPFQGETEEKRDHPKSPILQGLSKMARVGIEPTTPRFSVVCSTN